MRRTDMEAFPGEGTEISVSVGSAMLFTVVCMSVLCDEGRNERSLSWGEREKELKKDRDNLTLFYFLRKP